jgi:hypothetical protein
MYKQGQIGSTITWFVGFIIIFFLLMIFFASVGFLSQSKSKVDISFFKSEQKVVGDTKISLIFLEQNKEELSNWVDDKIQFSITQECDLANIFSDFSKDYNFEKPFLYLRTKEKDIFVKKNLEGNYYCHAYYFTYPQESDFGFPLVAEGIFVPALRDLGYDKRDFIERVYFISDEGNLGMLIFFDETELEEKNE